MCERERVKKKKKQAAKEKVTHFDFWTPAKKLWRACSFIWQQPVLIFPIRCQFLKLKKPRYRCL